jgi:integrase
MELSRKQTQEHCRWLLGRKPPRGLRAEITRHGTAIWVYRAPGVYHQMKNSPGSVPFWQEYTDASKGLRVADTAPSAQRLRANDPTSVGWLVNEYLGSLHFTTEFKPSTQKCHRNILKRFAEKHGGVPFRRVEAKAIKALRDHIAQFGGDPEKPKPAKAMANRVVSSIGGMYDWAADKGYVDEDANPCATVKKVKHVGKSHHKWTELECDAFETAYPIGTRERLMYELLQTGQRCCDIVGMGPQHIERHDEGELMKVTQLKTGKPAWAPIPPLLAEAIAKTPLGKETFIGSEHNGSPITAGHFSNVMRTACDQIGVPECTPHGLRHYVATHLLQQGCGVAELMAVLGDTMERCQGYIKGFEGEQAAKRVLRMVGRNRKGKPDLTVVRAA